MTSLTRPICLLIKGIHFLRGNPKGIHQRGLNLLKHYYQFETLFDSLIAKGLVKKYRGWAGTERGWVMRFSVLCKGWVVQFSAILRGWVTLFYCIDEQALSTNKTVDFTCYIKHSQLELFLTYSQTCCVRENIKGDRPHIYTGVEPSVNSFFFFFGSNEHVLY